MAEGILVNLHTHTSHSDGALPPEVLAARLASAGVRYAALCDHDTVEGWPAFRDALDARGVSSLPGIELTTQHEGRIIHLVAYGFDPEHPELLATLASMRAHRLLDTHSIQGSIRAAGTGEPQRGRHRSPRRAAGHRRWHRPAASCRRQGLPGPPARLRPRHREPRVAGAGAASQGTRRPRSGLRGVRPRRARGPAHPRAQARPARLRRHRLPRGEGTRQRGPRHRDATRGLGRLPRGRHRWSGPGREGAAARGYACAGCGRSRPTAPTVSAAGRS